MFNHEKDFYVGDSESWDQTSKANLIKKMVRPHTSTNTYFIKYLTSHKKHAKIAEIMEISFRSLKIDWMILSGVSQCYSIPFAIVWRITFIHILPLPLAILTCNLLLCVVRSNGKVQCALFDCSSNTNQINTRRQKSEYRLLPTINAQEHGQSGNNSCSVSHAMLSIWSWAILTWAWLWSSLLYSCILCMVGKRHFHSLFKSLKCNSIKSKRTFEHSNGRVWVRAQAHFHTIKCNVTLHQESWNG